MFRRQRRPGQLVPVEGRCKKHLGDWNLSDRQLETVEDFALSVRLYVTREQLELLAVHES